MSCEEQMELLSKCEAYSKEKKWWVIRLIFPIASVCFYDFDPFHYTRKNLIWLLYEHHLCAIIFFK